MKWAENEQIENLRQPKMWKLILETKSAINELENEQEMKEDLLELMEHALNPKNCESATKRMETSQNGEKNNKKAEENYYNQRSS